MKVEIKRVDPSLPLPIYATSGSVAIDLYSRIDKEIPPNEIAFIPSNIIIRTPPGYALFVIPRSSTPKKLGLSIPHGVGIIDQDYCGPDDEIYLQMYNFTNRPVVILRGQRICQGIFVKIAKIEWEEINETDSQNRGGFGSTG